MDAVYISAAFIMGLTGSLHCAGMCGPLVLVMPFNQLKGLQRLLAILIYHAGRITVYCLLALVLFYFKELFNSNWQRYISMGLGGALLLCGALYFFPIYKLPGFNLYTALSSRVNKYIYRTGKANFLLLGAVNGLLPCGIVYMALAGTLTLQNNWQVIAFIYAFGAGTLPMLVGITLLQARLKLSLQVVKQWVPAVMLLFGCLLILRGMNLGIPYLSPHIGMDNDKPVAECVTPARTQ